MTAFVIALISGAFIGAVVSIPIILLIYYLPKRL